MDKKRPDFCLFLATEASVKGSGLLIGIPDGRRHPKWLKTFYFNALTLAQPLSQCKYAKLLSKKSKAKKRIIYK